MSFTCCYDSREKDFCQQLRKKYSRCRAPVTGIRKLVFLTLKKTSDNFFAEHFRQDERRQPQNF